MNKVSRREAVKLTGLAVGAALLSNVTACGQNNKETHPDLDAVLRVEADAKRGISIRFDAPGTADQSFRSDEVRYAVLDKDGVQVKKALAVLPLAIHTTQLPKGQKSVSDYADFMFDPAKLKSGEEYYLVVSVRNLTALAKFKAGAAL